MQDKVGDSLAVSAKSQEDLVELINATSHRLDSVVEALKIQKQSLAHLYVEMQTSELTGSMTLIGQTFLAERLAEFIQLHDKMESLKNAITLLVGGKLSPDIISADILKTSQ